MKIIAKVIDDNGFKLELIRPLRDYPIHIGTAVEVTVSPKQTDLINMFNNLLDDETKDMIIGKFNEARTEKESTVHAVVTTIKKK